MRFIEKNCIYCDKSFFGRNILSRYCSRKCYDKDRYEKNRVQQIEKSLKYYYKNRKKILPKQVKYRMKRYKEDLLFKKKDNLRKRLCHQLSLKNKHCQYCGNKKDLQRHHPNLEKWNEFVILCRKCHNLVED